jgi:chaperonin GroEL
VIASDVRDAAVGVLLLNREKGVLENVLAVKAPSAAEQRTRILEDIAVLTGGRCVRQKLNERLEEVQPGDLGRARQAWATTSAFGILGGAGDRAAIRQRLNLAKGELTVSGLPEYDRQKIKERIGKLAGTGAIVRVGAPSQSEREELKLRLEAAVQSARLALQEGVVPGGGAALVACLPALESLGLQGDEAMGVEILARTLTDPLRSIARNAGAEPEAILYEARRRGPGWAYDAIRREWVEPWESGLLDPLAVVRTALQAGVSAGATALTSEVLVHRKKPPVEYQP